MEDWAPVPFETPYDVHSRFTVKGTGFIDVNNLLMFYICSKSKCALCKFIALYEHCRKNNIPEMGSVFKSVSQFHYFFQTKHRISAFDTDLLRLDKINRRNPFVYFYTMRV
jgi:hypothetical protein